MFPQVLKFQETTYFAGPLPSPETLHQYNQITPGAADRIIAMAEREAEHRHRMESRMLVIHGRNSTLGVLSAWLIGMTAVGGGAYGIALGADIGGAGIALTGLASLGAVFIFQHRQDRE